MRCRGKKYFFASMSPVLVLGVLLVYFALLMVISWVTRDTSNQAFFLGKKESPWYIVAFGMIGASLSGVTFISIPGWVQSSQFSYFQMVLGYLPGYLVIATVLMPLYYRLNLTSIYTYLEDRFGFWSYKAGAFFFILSRIIGASFRLYLVAIVLQYAVFDKLEMEVPFAVTVTLTIVLIWLYTFRGGIKTIIWTDTLQTLFMLLAVGFTLIVISQHFGWGPSELITAVQESEYGQAFFWDDWGSSKHFVKNFVAGAFMAIVMTGLDQDMMQKNLSCRTIGDAQKNMFWFSIILVGVNILFLSLGAVLYLFAADQGIALPEKTDYLYPVIAMDGYLGIGVAVFFIIGLVAAAYSSADSALTALTTSVCVDFLGISSRDQAEQVRIRKGVHITLSLILIGVILVFKAINNDSVISELFTAAGFTYGPLLGLYAFGLFTPWKIRDRWVLPVVILSPLLSYVIKSNAPDWFGYTFGFEILLVNGLLTFIGLFLIRKR